MPKSTPAPRLAVAQSAIEQFGRHLPGTLVTPGAPGLRDMDFNGRTRKVLVIRTADFNDFLNKGVLREVEAYMVPPEQVDPGFFGGADERPFVPGFSWSDPSTVTLVPNDRAIGAIIGALGPDDAQFLDAMIEAEGERSPRRAKVVEQLALAKVALYEDKVPQRRQSPAAKAKAMAAAQKAANKG